MMRRTLAVAVISQFLGCSFALVSGPPRNHEQLPYVDCTTSKLGPILDTVWTGLQTLNLVSAAVQTDAEWADNFAEDPPFERSTAIPLYASLAALGAAGMYYGYSRTSRCKDAKQQQMIRSQGGGTLAPTPTGTWPPPAPGTAPAAPGPGTWPPPAPAPAPGTAPAPAPGTAPAPAPGTAPAPAPGTAPAPAPAPVPPPAP